MAPGFSARTSDPSSQQPCGQQPAPQQPAAPPPPRAIGSPRMPSASESLWICRCGTVTCDKNKKQETRGAGLRAGACCVLVLFPPTAHTSYGPNRKAGQVEFGPTRTGAEHRRRPPQWHKHEARGRVAAARTTGCCTAIWTRHHQAHRQQPHPHTRAPEPMAGDTAHWAREEGRAGATAPATQHRGRAEIHPPRGRFDFV
jgi:hypothetical protein